MHAFSFDHQFDKMAQNSTHQIHTRSPRLGAVAAVKCGPSSCVAGRVNRCFPGARRIALRDQQGRG